jgi:hypothetical protein
MAFPLGWALPSLAGGDYTKHKMFGQAPKALEPLMAFKRKRLPYNAPVGALRVR